MVVAIAETERITDIKLNIPDFGHVFMSTIVAFLVVSRCTIALNLDFEHRGACSNLFRGCRQLVERACIWTQHDSSEPAQEWRRQVAWYAMLLLKVTATMLKQNNCWDIPQLPAEDKERLRRGFSTTINYSNSSSYNNNNNNSLDDDDTPIENMRGPIRMAYKLSAIVSSQVQPLKLNSQRERQLMDCIDKFMDGYYNLRKYITIPYPFSLVQMARAIVFLYIYTMPFVIVSKIEQTYEAMTLAFFVAYGFLGVEFVAIELHDPFGNDARFSDNDIPIEDQTDSVCQDICFIIAEVDGMDAAKVLFQQISSSPPGQELPGNLAGTSFDLKTGTVTEQTTLLSGVL